MAFNYFQQDLKPSRLRRITLFLTRTAIRTLPRLSLLLGRPLFLNTRKRSHTGFGDLTPSQTLELNAKAGAFKVHLFGQGASVAIVSHGWGDHSGSMSPVIEQLLSQGYRVAAIDHVGHGKTAGKHSHLLAFIEATELTIEHFEAQGKNVTALVAHSMAGVAVMNLNEAHLADKQVVLISVPVKFFNLMFRTVEQAGIAKEAIQHVLHSITQSYGRTWQELESERHQHKLDERFIFIHDEHDRLAPYDDTHAMISSAPARLVTTQGAGHRKILSHESVVQVLDEHLALA